jgi:hypothetical protein
MRVSGQGYAPTALWPPGKDRRYPLYRRLGGSQSRSGHRGSGKILSPLPGIELGSPGRPAHGQTLHWLSYPAHQYYACQAVIKYSLPGKETAVSCRWGPEIVALPLRHFLCYYLIPPSWSHPAEHVRVQWSGRVQNSTATDKIWVCVIIVQLCAHRNVCGAVCDLSRKLLMHFPAMCHTQGVSKDTIQF